MYAAIRRYRVDPELADEIIHLLLEDFAPQVRKIQGYISYNILNEGHGKILVIKVFEHRAGVQESSDLALTWMAENLAKFISRSADATYLKVEEFKGPFYGEASSPTYQQASQKDKITSPNGFTMSSASEALKLYSVEELCEVLGVGKSWLYKRLRNGEIPSVRVGHFFRVRQEDLDGYLEKQRYSG
jgi:excisionase family DNA binding protein